MLILVNSVFFCYAHADYQDYLKQLQSMNIDTDKISDQNALSRYDVARLLNTSECQDCVKPNQQRVNMYNQDFWNDFSPTRDFQDINFQ